MRGSCNTHNWGVCGGGNHLSELIQGGISTHLEKVQPQILEEFLFSEYQGRSIFKTIQI